MKEVDNTWKEKLCLNSHIHMIGITVWVWQV